MKRKLLVLFLAMASSVALSIGLAACDSGGNGGQGGNGGNEQGGDNHTHSLTHVDAVEATCDETGAVEHWECSVCDKCFSDENATTEITDITVAALGHDWGDWTVTTAATCTTVGEETRTCSYNSSHTETREIAKTHTYEDGVCTVCGALKPTEGLVYTTYPTYAAVTGVRWMTDTGIVIPDDYKGLPVTSIEYYAFANCASLESITIPDTVVNIGDNAFSGCDLLKNIFYGGDIEGWLSISGLLNLMSFGSSSYKKLYINDALVMNIDIPEGVTKIPDYAFNGFYLFKNITIPDSVTSIGGNAFSGCTALESITVSDGVTSIGDYAFDGCTSLESVTIGNGVTSIGDYTFNGCASLTSIIVSEDNTSYTSQNGILYNKAKTEFIHIPGVIKGDIIIPDGITSIGENVFSHYSAITSIVIPDSVTSIGGYAFYGCTSLESIIMGNGIASIGDYAFKDCSSLESLNIPNSVTAIGEWAFYGCASIESIIMGNGVTSIAFGAFYECASLNSVYYKGTAENWDKIDIGSANESLTVPIRFYYSEGKPNGIGCYWHYDTDGVTPVIWREHN